MFLLDQGILADRFAGRQLVLDRAQINRGCNFTTLGSFRIPPPSLAGGEWSVCAPDWRGMLQTAWVDSQKSNKLSSFQPWTLKLEKWTVLVLKTLVKKFQRHFCMFCQIAVKVGVCVAFRSLRLVWKYEFVWMSILWVTNCRIFLVSRVKVQKTKSLQFFYLYLQSVMFLYVKEAKAREVSVGSSTLVWSVPIF